MSAPYNQLHKKIMILLDPDNKLWGSLFPGKTINISKNCQNCLGVTHAALVNWMNRRQYPDSSTIRNIVNTVEKTKDKHGITLTEQDFEDSSDRNPKELSDYLLQDEYKFGELLGLSIDDCQKIIDRRLFKNMPLFSGFYYSRNSSREDYERYSGIYKYYLYSKLKKSDPPIIFRGALRIRYALNIKSHSYILRCKLHVPSVSGNGYLDYDGVLSCKDDHFLSWVFEKRPPGRRDFVTIMTNKGDPQNQCNLQLSGLYSSINQNGEKSAPYSSKIYLVRTFSDDKLTSLSTIKETQAKFQALFDSMGKNQENDIAAFTKAAMIRKHMLSVPKILKPDDLNQEAFSDEIKKFIDDAVLLA